MFAATNNSAQAYQSTQSNSVVVGLFQRFSAYRLYRKTIAELETLNDRELSDFGIDRIAIPRVAREAVYGR